MNFTARIKSARYKPNYVLNVSIDIPIRPQQLLSDRPVSGQFTFSPSQLKKRLKLQLPSSKTSREPESKRASYLGDTQHTIPFPNNHKKKLPRSLLGSCVTSHKSSKKNRLAYKSEATSPSRKKTSGKSSKLVSSNKTIKNSKILHRLASESEDNIIRYTNQSSELKKQIQDSISFKKKNSKNNGMQASLRDYDVKTPPFLSESELEQFRMIRGIREFEKTAEQKKQSLHYLYLKEKILILASVKKIQRAWRSYRTKKLLKSYSNPLSLKLTGKMKGIQSNPSFQQKSILSVRSCGTSRNSAQFKKANKKQFNEKQFEDNQREKPSKDDSNSAKAQFQIEEIKKWQQLIKQIREGKKVEDVLVNSFKRKQQLEQQIKDLGGKNKKEKQYSFFGNKQGKCKKERNLASVSLSSEGEEEKNFRTIEEKSIQLEKMIEFEATPERSECEYENQLGTTQRRRRKLQFFENEIRKIDNEGSESNFSHSFSLDQKLDSESSLGSPALLKKNPKQFEIEENQKLKRKIELLTKLSLMQSSINDESQEQDDSQQAYANERRSKFKETQANIIRNIQKQNNKEQIGEVISQKKQENDEDCLDTFRNSTLEKENEDDFPKVLTTIWKNSQEKDKLASKIEEEIIYELLLEFSESELIVLRMKELFELSKAHVLNKPEGICTNLESIKDYLENFVAFIFEQCPSILIQGLKTPIGFTDLQFLKQLQNNQEPSPTSNKKIIENQLFERHWQYASEQIYFDVKHPNNPVKQKERVEHLKNITKIFFTSIFDGFNECLDFSRHFGKKGRPFSWFPNLRNMTERKVKNLNEAKPLIRLAYKKLSQLAIVYCGLHMDDKRQKIPVHIEKEVQEERMNAMLDIELEQNEYRWELSQEAVTEVLEEISQCVSDWVLVELCRQLPVFL